MKILFRDDPSKDGLEPREMSGTPLGNSRWRYVGWFDKSGNCRAIRVVTE